MHNPAADASSDSPDPAGARYRTITFDDGLVVYDREDTSRWIHADGAVPLASMR